MTAIRNACGTRWRPKRKVSCVKRPFPLSGCDNFRPAWKIGTVFSRYKPDAECPGIALGAVDAAGGPPARLAVGILVW